MLALTVGAPALADDTELLLVTPATAQNNKPNILFILDTSGSMDTLENTIAPYDSTLDYLGGGPGACDIDRMYWTDVSTVPDCATSGQYIDDDNFWCDAAINPVNGIGSYAGVLAQYRDGGPDGTTVGPKKWQDLAASYNSEPVECQADSGVHGDGRSGYLWAKSGTNHLDWFTNDPTEEISWGSTGANRDYTFYDGNYLNWKNSPVIANIQRIDIVKAVVSAVMKAITNVNVGIQRFNDNEGGPIIQGLTDIDTNRASVLAAINSLNAAGGTPLSEVMYEAALYWRGMDAHYGNLINESPTDPGALDTTIPENYKQPETNVCSKNYNVMLSDGQPNNNEDAPLLTPTLPNFLDGRCPGALLDLRLVALGTAGRKPFRY